jgi:hypothetical protein
MATMVRKQIYLDKDTDLRLKREAKALGISQAALIRQRISQDEPGVAIPNPKARQELLDYLKWVQENAGPGPGAGWKFNRDEIYEERLEKARPGRHQRPGVRRGSQRTS